MMNSPTTKRRWRCSGGFRLRPYFQNRPGSALDFSSLMRYNIGILDELDNKHAFRNTRPLPVALAHCREYGVMSIRLEDRGLTLRLFITCDEAMASLVAGTATPYAGGWIARTEYFRWADAAGLLPSGWDPSPEFLVVTGAAPAVAPPLRDDTPPPPTARPRPPRSNTPIEVLLREYEAEKCDHSDLEWVSRTALHYAAGMPDGQVRCLLHVLATHVRQATQPKPPIPCNPADTAEPPHPKESNDADHNP